MRNLTLAEAARDAVYVCAACCANGIVRISVTRNPEDSIRRRPNVVAAQWAWVGSESSAKLLVRHLRRRWAARYVVGEGYCFDYGAEGAEFRHGLNQAFFQAVRGAARWEKLGPEALRVFKMCNRRHSNELLLYAR
ncbi:TPA: hypothetical protein RNT09_000043 [Stenotrophomonas maltophilia]|uniref:hypothetical protein n=1 Tax=Stenotrophomonas maltophilia TaxID=40324 RepID=UPI00027A6EB2|nr:hypothetical protein [Stenotrophomonas maltophilia]EJP76844.1 hypothetical protein A1OC_01647 [Stenotrophomonas maltophilia Ab55555]ELE7120589.1 hypothetical protein [Stenotrophomonas maltophilia]HDS3802334.1 hypothetical protein [Stenotrophomonas maltophilia]HDX0801176.1 hypothetical protein [Stenotrophomonas maltophilia]HDX0816986.1 hypothetical protein [Stenotrophomonas maltophilia]